MCEGCGTCHDRDYNASVNLEHAARSSWEAKNACGEEGSGLKILSNETILYEAGMKHEV